MAPHRETKQRPLQRLARPFIAGTLALFPLVLTISIVAWMGSLIRGFLGPHSGFGRILRGVGLAFVGSDIVAYLIGLATALGLIYLLGVLVEVGMKKRWQSFTDRLLARVPLVNTIYDAAKKVAQMVEPRGESDLHAMTPVLCRFGEEGGTAFPALMPTSEPLRINGRDYHTVMIPTAPVPFGGAILCVPVEWITRLDCGVDGLFNIYMSMGVTAPEYLGEKPRPNEQPRSAP